MTEEDGLRKAQSDIQVLTNNMTRLTTIVEGEVENRKDDRVLMKEMVQGFSGLNERISSLIGIERDIKSLTDVLTETKSDVRTLTHDMRDMKQGMGGIKILEEKISEITSVAAAHGAKIEGLESFRDRLDGAGVAGLGDRMKAMEVWRAQLDGAGIAKLNDKIHDLEATKATETGVKLGVGGVIKALWSILGLAVGIAGTWLSLRGTGTISGE